MSAAPRCQVFDPFLIASEANAVVAAIKAAAPLGVYIEGPVKEGFGKGLVRRYDAALNYLRQRMGTEDAPALVARLNLFRKTLALHDELMVPAIEPIYRSEALIAASRSLMAASVVNPAMLYVNVLLPGQELALHTDTPEYRGLDKWCVPEWLLVVMHHSQLFEPWRKRVAAGVAFVTDCIGGEFVFYPDGPNGAPSAVPVRHNTAVHLDVDRIFHGVDRVGGPETPAPPLLPDMTLRFVGGERWELGRGGTVAATYDTAELRISLQWKANCWRDEAEAELAASHRDDLSLDRVLDRLVEDLRERGRIQDKRPGDGRLASLLINEYIHFPDAA